MKKLYLTISGSGGLHEVAPALGKPVLILLYESGRPGAFEMGGDAGGTEN